MQIELDNVAIEIIRKPIKNMYLRVNSATGDVKVTAPLKFPLKSIQVQLEAKRAWIHAARNRVISRVALSPITMNHGERHHFLGEPYSLVVQPSVQLKDIVIEGAFLHGFLE